MRPNVISEILQAIRHEREAGTQKLFPIRLDDFIFSAEADTLFQESTPPHLKSEDWLGYIRQFHILDFSKWRSRKAYAETFAKLLYDLQNSA